MNAAAAQPIEDEPTEEAVETAAESDIRRSTSPFYYVTEDEFLELPETTERLELIDGEIHVAPSATAEHQLILQELGYQLETWIRQHRKPRPAMRYAPCDVRFGPDRVLQPDLFVVLAGLPRRQPMPIRTVPDLCVEVLSQNRIYDRLAKRLIYAEAGVTELWTVDPAGFVEQWTGPGLTHREICKAALATPLLPGFSLNVAALFADDAD